MMTWVSHILYFYMYVKRITDKIKMLSRIMKPSCMHIPRTTITLGTSLSLENYICLGNNIFSAGSSKVKGSGSQSSHWQKEQSKTKYLPPIQSQGSTSSRRRTLTITGPLASGQGLLGTLQMLDPVLM